MQLSSKKGFTLVEALIASGVMAIGLLAVITGIYLQTTLLNKTREQTTATLTAQGEIENIRGMTFNEILALTSFNETNAPGLTYLHYGPGFGKGDISVDSAGFTIDPNIRRVSVTVTWNSINGKTLTKTMSTLVTKNGINKQ